MPDAARITDTTSHGGTIIGPGIQTVIIGGLPAAVNDSVHVCALNPQHAPGPFLLGSMTVLIGGKMALRVGDMAACGAVIVKGCPNVIIG